MLKDYKNDLKLKKRRDFPQHGLDLCTVDGLGKRFQQRSINWNENLEIFVFIKKKHFFDA
jgi:hypothetical protein